MTRNIKITQSKKVSEFPIPSISQKSLSILDYINTKGFFVTAPCGSSGICGGCKIFLNSGTLKRISDGSLINGPAYIKSCQFSFSSEDCEIEIPEKFTKKSLSSRTTHLGSIFDTLRKNLIFNSEQEDKYGIAIDIGTTNISILLSKLSDGNIINAKHVINAQIAFASDVVSRINLCLHDKSFVSTLEACLIDKSILPSIDSIIKESTIKPESIEHIAISGNTTMLHLLCGEDPSSLGTYPFNTVFIDAIQTSFEKLAPHCGKDTTINSKTTILPGFSAFVGADIIAGIYALDMHTNPDNTILVDIGTNGEIALKTPQAIFVTSTAAGPVFEGFGLECGVTAIDGAINEIYFEDGDILFKTVNSLEPLGICGSGYISFLANARKASLIDSLGKFENGQEIKIKNSNIVITQSDISRLLQAKASIASGIQILLKTANLTEREIKKVYLAGSFGSNLKIDYAINSGLLGNFEPSQIECVGNSSLAGCYKYIMQNAPLDELKKIASSGVTLNLNQYPDFADWYIDSLYLP